MENSTNNQDDILLEVKDLNVAFSSYKIRKQVLFDINLKIKKGQRVAVVGESGSGKSVTVKTIMDTLPHQIAQVEKGEILYQSEDLLKMTPQARNRLKGQDITMVFQDPQSSFNPVFKIGNQLDDILYWADKHNGIKRSKKERKASILESLAKVQLPNPEYVYNAYPIMLSGGMRQRVLIAMALLNTPNVLIADEPGTALDVSTQDEILHLLNDLVENEGLSFLIITHNLGVVKMAADYVYVMQHGVIVEEGNVTDIFENPQHDYTKSLIDAVPKLNAEVTTRSDISDAEPALKINQLNKVFKSGNQSVKAVNNVSFEIKQGEIFGLAGESGSGKTSLAKIILGLYNATSGDVEFAKYDEENIKEVEFVYQNPTSSLNPRKTLEQIISAPLRINKMPKSEQRGRVQELLRLVKLPEDMINRYPHELSGGQKQRVAIARALAVNPKFLILDEPTSALDVSVQKIIIELLEELREKLNLTYLFISHDLALMRNFCDRIAVMKTGQIVELEDSIELFDNPKHDYTRALISCVPVISDAEAEMKPALTRDERKIILSNSN